MRKMNIYILIAAVLTLVLYGIYFTFSFFNSLGYKVGGKSGFSYSIEESMARNVYQYDLSFEIVSENNINLDNLAVFVEKRFAYGNLSIFETTTEYGYQLIIGCENSCEIYKPCDYDCSAGGWGNSKIKIMVSEGNSSHYLVIQDRVIQDTLEFVIMKESKENDTLGKLIIWNKYPDM